MAPMDASVRLGRVAGIEVGLRWSLAVVFVLIVWTLTGQVFPELVPDQSQSAYWLVLIFLGLFLMSAARNEEAHVMMHGALAGLLVSDVMTRDTMVAPGWITVDEFMRTYLPIRRAAAYPLKTFDGALDGLVTLTRLAEVPPELRRTTRARDVGIGLDGIPTATPGEPVVAVLSRFAAGDGHVFVMAGGRLVGVVTPADITRALGDSVLRRGRTRTSS
jgi:CBS domain-containing protein